MGAGTGVKAIQAEVSFKDHKRPSPVHRGYRKPNVLPASLGSKSHPGLGCPPNKEHPDEEDAVGYDALQPDIECGKQPL